MLVSPLCKRSVCTRAACDNTGQVCNTRNTALHCLVTRCLSVSQSVSVIVGASCYLLRNMVFARVILLLLAVSTLDIAIDAKQSGLETNDVADYFAINSINFIFDFFLKRFTNKLIEKGHTAIKTSDFERGFKEKVLFVDIEGSVEVKDGWCSNVSTLHRTGDADIVREDEREVLSAHLGLADLRIDYNSYNVSFLDTHQKGEIHVKVGYNSIFIKLNVQTKPKCEVYLSAFQIEDLDDIQVDITNLGIFESLTDDITSWASEEATKWFKSYIEETLYPEISQVVKKADLCKYIPF